MDTGRYHLINISKKINLIPIGIDGCESFRTYNNDKIEKIENDDVQDIQKQTKITTKDYLQNIHVHI